VRLAFHGRDDGGGKTDQVAEVLMGGWNLENAGRNRHLELLRVSAGRDRVKTRGAAGTKTLEEKKELDGVFAKERLVFRESSGFSFSY